MELQKEIISCLWSEDLKRYIEETGFRFSEEDLLAIAYNFAPTFAERLRLLELVARHCPSVADHAEKCITYQEKCLAHFLRHSPDQVYELKILDNPSDPQDYEERYLCESYEAALDMIDGFYKEYDFSPEQPTVRYTIAKRCILHKGNSFREDDCGEAILGAGKVLLSVDNIPDETEFGPCQEDCVGCTLPCIYNMEAAFPPFLPDRSPVRYRLPNGKEEYGIHLKLNWVGLGCELYVIPLDGEMMNTRDFDAHWGGHWHQHIPAPYVRSVPLDSLPQNLRDNLHAFRRWYREKFPRLIAGFLSVKIFQKK